MRVAIVTARAAVGADDDELVLLAALSVVGTDAQVVLWDDPARRLGGLRPGGRAVDLGLLLAP
jgi:hypothetical protein